MNVLITIIHVIVCLILIAIVLIQRGRGGGGLVEGLSGVESMFGTKTTAFLTKTTTICSVIFFLTCLSLALLSVRQSRSLLHGKNVAAPAAASASAAAETAAEAPAAVPAPATTVPEGTAKTK